MRIQAISRLLIVSETLVAISDHCWTVGLRIHKKLSTCQDGKCTNPFFPRNKSDGDEQESAKPQPESPLWNRFPLGDLSCTDAEETIRGMVWPSITGIAESGHELRELMNGIKQMFRKLAYERVPLEQQDIDLFSRASELMSGLLSPSIVAKSRSAIIMEYLSTTATASLGATFKVLLSQQSFRASIDPRIDESVSQAVNFYIDFLSLLGPSRGQDIRRWEFFMAADVALQFPVRYRDQYPGEKSLDRSRCGIPTHPVATVAFARGLEGIRNLGKRVSNKSPLPEIKASVPLRIYNVLLCWDPQDGKSSSAILYHQLQAQVCPDYANAVYGLYSGTGETMRFEFARITLLLSRLCASSAHGHVLFTASLIAASFIDNGRSLEPVTLYPDEPLESLIVLDSVGLTWYAGTDSESESCVFRVKLLNTFMEHYAVFFKEVSGGLRSWVSPSTFSTRMPFERAFRALGRIIGLCLNKDCSLTSLRFTPEDIAAIHSQHIDNTPVMLLGEDLIDIIYEPAWYTTEGIREVLGPLGPSVFSIQVWMSKFVQ